MLVRSIQEIKDEVKASYPLIRVLESAGVRLRPAGGAWLAALCPFPNHSETKPSFKINRNKPTRFICFGCNAKGTVFEFLRDCYGCRTLNEQLTYLTGKSLTQWRRGDSISSGAPTPRLPQPSTSVSSPEEKYRAADAAVLSEVYKSLLHLLTLDAEHRGALTKDRRFPDSVAYDLGYRSLPVCRDTRVMLCGTLRGLGLDLWRVPGFFRLPRKDGQGMGPWCFGGSPTGDREVRDRGSGEVFPTGGILIPTRSPSGQIVRLTVRNDPIPKEASLELRESERWPQKYMALSSANRTGGATATVTVHCAGPVDGGDYPGTIWVTEGQMKADISAYHLNARVLGQPGVNLATPQVLDILRQERATALYVAHDQDPELKIQVLLAIKRLVIDAESLGLDARVVSWDKRLGKGLDDLLTGDGDWTLLPPEVWWNSLTVEQRVSVEGRLQGSCINSPASSSHIPSLASKACISDTGKGTGEIKR